MANTMIAPEHKKFFKLNGFIAFDDLVSESMMQKLLEHTESQMTGSKYENFLRSFPKSQFFSRKTGNIAADLLDKRPLRIRFDCATKTLDEIPEIQERELGFLLSSSGRGLFFTQRSHLYNGKEPWYVLIIFTANYVNTPMIVFP